MVFFFFCRKQQPVLDLLLNSAALQLAEIGYRRESSVILMTDQINYWPQVLRHVIGELWTDGYEMSCETKPF